MRMLKAREEAASSWNASFDVLVHVFGFLTDMRDVGRCAMVSRAWREAADSRALWSRLFERLWCVSSIFLVIFVILFVVVMLNGIGSQCTVGSGCVASAWG